MSEPREETPLNEFLFSTPSACPACAAAISHAPADACPKCNTELKLAVTPIEPRLGAFISGVVALAASFGFSTLMLFGIWLSIPSGENYSMPRETLLTLAIASSTSAITLSVWILMRRAFQKRSPAARNAISACCWIIPTVAVVVVILVVN